MSYIWGAARAKTGGERRSAAGSVEAEGDRRTRAADELAPMVRVWEQLIDQHRPDPAGCCQQCGQGGAGGSATPWPCSVYGIAQLARDRHRELQRDRAR